MSRIGTADVDQPREEVPMSDSPPLRDPLSDEWVGVRMTNPVFGESIEVEAIGRDETGPFVRGRLRVAPGGSGPPRHVHPNHRERFEVMSGELTVYLDGKWRRLSEGDSLVVPPGTSHGFENPRREPVEFLGTIRPSSRITHVIATLSGLAHDGELNADGSPRFLQAMVFAREMKDLMYLSSPPYPVQWIMWTVLAPVARLLGYRATYDRHLRPEFWERGTGDREGGTAR